MVEKLADLAATFTDQRHDDRVRACAAREGAQQRTLTDARAGEQTQPLTHAQRQEPINRTNSRYHRLGDPAS